MGEGGVPGLEVGRVAEVIVRMADGSERRGSGYLVCAGRVLTAAHVVEGAVATYCRFNADRTGERRRAARPAFVDGPADIAVLDLGDAQGPAESGESGEPVGPVGPARFGRVGERDAVLRCSALGFPRFKLLDGPDGSRYRDAEHVRATVPVLSNRREGTLDLQVAPPRAENPWPGMSGAAVFAAGRIVGVVTRHHPAYGPGRLAAGRVDRWPELMTAERLGELSALLHTSLRGLPDVLPTSRVDQLDAGHRDRLTGIAPERLLDREAELDELAGFCGGAEPYRWIQAPPWTGKTALAAWFALHPPDGVAPVSFFVTNREAASADSSDYIDAVIMQCARLAGRDPMLLASPHARADECRLLLKEAARRVGETGGTLLLLVDGLDEDRSGARQLISVAALLPAAPAENVRVLVLSRTSPGVPADVPGGHPLRTCPRVGLTPSRAAGHTEIDAQLDLALALSGGNATAAQLVGLLTASRGGLSRSDLAQLSGLDHWMLDQQLGSLFGRVVRERAPTQQQFGAIAADGSPRGYLLAHETLHAAAEEVLGPDLDAYRDRLHAWSDRYRDAGWPAGTPAYLLGGYVRMLVSTGDRARAVILATDPVRHRRMRIDTGSDWAALSEIAAVAAAADDPGDRLALSVARTVLRLRSVPIGTDFAVALAEFGEVSRAVELARSLYGTAARAVALAGIALTPEVRRREGGQARAEELIAEARELCGADQVDGSPGPEGVVVACALAEVGRVAESRDAARGWRADGARSPSARTRLAKALAPHDPSGARELLASAADALLADWPDEEEPDSHPDLLSDVIQCASVSATAAPELVPELMLRIEELTEAIGSEDAEPPALVSLNVVGDDPATARRLALAAAKALRAEAAGHESARAGVVRALVGAGLLTEAESLLDELGARCTPLAAPVLRALAGSGDRARAEAWLGEFPQDDQARCRLELVAGLAESGDFAAAREHLSRLDRDAAIPPFRAFPRPAGVLGPGLRRQALAFFDEVTDRLVGARSLGPGALGLLAEALAEVGGPDDLADAELLVVRGTEGLRRARFQLGLIGAHAAHGRGAAAEALAEWFFEQARAVPGDASRGERSPGDASGGERSPGDASGGERSPGGYVVDPGLARALHLARPDLLLMALLAAERTGRRSEAKEFGARVLSPTDDHSLLWSLHDAACATASRRPPASSGSYAWLLPERTEELGWRVVASAISLTSSAAGSGGEHDLAARVAALLAAQEPTGSEERTVAALVMAGTDPRRARDLLRSAPPDPDRGEGRPLPLEHAFGFVAAGAPDDIEPGRYVSEADRTDRADEFRGLLAAALVGFAPHALANALIARPWFLGHDLSMAAPTYLAQARAAQLAPRGAAADALARRLVDDLLSGEHWHHALPALTVLAPDAVRRTRDAVRTYVGHLG